MWVRDEGMRVRMWLRDEGMSVCRRGYLIKGWGYVTQKGCRCLDVGKQVG